MIARATLGVLVSVALGAVVTLEATAGSEASRVIRPGQAIGKLRLGMTPADARRAMGPPSAVVRRPAGFGLLSIEYQWRLAAYTVRFVGARGRLRAVRATTVLRRERTPKGIGPGSLERDLRRAYPQVRCSPLRITITASIRYVSNSGRECTLRTASGRRTIFRTSVSVLTRDRLTPAKFLRRARIDEVVVGSGGA